MQLQAWQEEQPSAGVGVGGPQQLVALALGPPLEALLQQLAAQREAQQCVVQGKELLLLARQRAGCSEAPAPGIGQEEPWLSNKKRCGCADIQATQAECNLCTVASSHIPHPINPSHAHCNEKNGKSNRRREQHSSGSRHEGDLAAASLLELAASPSASRQATPVGTAGGPAAPDGSCGRAASGGGAFSGREGSESRVKGKKRRRIVPQAVQAPSVGLLAAGGSCAAVAAAEAVAPGEEQRRARGLLLLRSAALGSGAGRPGGPSGLRWWQDDEGWEQYIAEKERMVKELLQVRATLVLPGQERGCIAHCILISVARGVGLACMWV